MKEKRSDSHGMISFLSALLEDNWLKLPDRITTSSKSSTASIKCFRLQSLQIIWIVQFLSNAIWNQKAKQFFRNHSFSSIASKLLNEEISKSNCHPLCNEEFSKSTNTAKISAFQPVSKEIEVSSKPVEYIVDDKLNIPFPVFLKHFLFLLADAFERSPKLIDTFISEASVLQSIALAVCDLHEMALDGLCAKIVRKAFSQLDLSGLTFFLEKCFGWKLISHLFTATSFFDDEFYSTVHSILILENTLKITYTRPLNALNADDKSKIAISNCLRDTLEEEGACDIILAKRRSFGRFNKLPSCDIFTSVGVHLWK